MKFIFVHYELATEKIIGIHHTTGIASADQYPIDKTKHGMIVIRPDHPILAEQLRWRVKTGQLVRKAVVRVKASANILRAGSEQAELAFKGLLSPATVVLGTEGKAQVSPANPKILFGSSTKGVFEICLADEKHWCEPVYLEFV